MRQKSDSPLSINRLSDLTGTFALSYLVSAALIAALIATAGIWNFLANTRLLDPLISAGVIKYHDMQAGFIDGIPEVKYYLLSQDPIDWRLMFVVVLLILVYWLVKAVQFHGISRYYGSNENFGGHIQAFYYGLGINSLMPYNTGDLATAIALEKRGQSFRNTLNAVFLTRAFFIFEIVFYAFVGLITLGWSTWLTQIFWGLVIFAILYYFLRGTRPDQDAALVPAMKQIIGNLAQSPLHLVLWCALSIIAFGLEHIAAYATVMAFTSEHVILNVDFSVLVMGLVGGYIARLIPLTPGGIGQFEWGFAAALFLGGLGFPEAATIAVLYGLVRYTISTISMLIVRMAYGVNTSMSEVFARFAH